MKNLLLAIFLIGSSVFAQSPYQLSWKLDLPIVLGSNTLMATGLLIPNGISPLTQAELDALNPMNVNAFDRSATQNYSIAADHRSDIGLVSGAILGLGVNLALPTTKGLQGKAYWKEAGKLALIWYEANTLVTGATLSTKALILRPRPFTYNPNAPLEDKMEVDARFSFFSGHTSITSVNFFLLGKFYADYFPESKYKPAVWAVAAIIPAWTGIERYNAGKHYLTDVITGYVVGAAGGILVPHFHKKKDKATSFLLYPINNTQVNGIGLLLRF
ncbi:MAG: phosphatase PAP2 family protein [Bacteroidia bacterium]|nr:phosphatase PAP2 family protein [Bacteroidia bacterium]